MTNKEQAKDFKNFEADHSVRHGVAEKRHEEDNLGENPELGKSERLEEVRHKVELESKGKNNLLDRLEAEQEEVEEDFTKRPANAQLKNSALANEIGHIRRKLGRTDRVVSKLIHQPIVRSVSEVSSKTITRPSGLLGGGITAFLGTSAYLFFTKYIGLKYNYSIFLFLLVAGFILGVIIEAVFRVTKGRSTP